MKYYLAIDIGASSGRHILGYLENDKLVLEDIHRFSNQPVKQGDYLIWEDERLYNEILTGIKKCKDMNKIPYSIAIDTWGVDYALLDSNGKAVKPLISYRDNRTKDFVDTVIPFNELYKKTGIQFVQFNTLYQLLADKASGRMENAKEFLMLPEYFSYLLTGNKAREYTNATTTGLVNAEKRNWDTDIINGIGLNIEMFKDIVEPGFVLGELTGNIQKSVGFNAKVVLPATHDTASAVISVPEEDCIFISSGTWSLLGVVRSPILSDEAMKANYSNEGAPNGKVRFQKNIMGLWIIQSIRHELEDKYSFSELVEMAEKEAVYDWSIDINDAEFFSPDSMIDTVKNQCGKEKQPVPKSVGELAHCVYNSLAHSYKTAIDDLENITKKVYDKVCIIGGGSKNNYLNKLTSRITKKSIYAGPDEATAIGNLIMQINSSGDLVSENEIKSLIKNSFNIKEIK